MQNDEKKQPDIPILEQYPEGASPSHQEIAKKYDTHKPFMSNIMDMYEDPVVKSERLKKEDSRLKFTRNVANITDAVSALVNSYNTAKGANSMQLTSNSNNVAKKEEDILRLRRANDDRYREAYMRAMQLDNNERDKLAGRDYNDALRAQKDKIDAVNSRNNNALREYDLKNKQYQDQKADIRYDEAQWAKDAQIAEQNRIRREAIDARLKAAGYKTSKTSRTANNQDSITLQNDKGEREVLYYDKVSNGAALAIYNMMVEANNNRPKDKQLRDIDDIKMGFGEGGDQSSKILSIVKRKSSDFPELTDEIKRLLTTQEVVNESGDNFSIYDEDDEFSIYD